MDKTAKDANNKCKETAKESRQTVPEENKIAILDHNIFRDEDENGRGSIIIELNIKNVMDRAVGSVVFEAAFSDKDGNVIDIVEQKVSGLAPNGMRTVRLVHREDTTKPVENYSVKVRDIVMVPKPSVSGNDMILITKHELKYMDNAILEGLECGIKNISDNVIATLMIECTFFDGEGSIVNVARHKETNLLPGNSRGILITVPMSGESFRIQSYNARIFRIITADIEKVQIVQSDMKAVGNDKEVNLICKNISSEKTDAAIIVKFFNEAKEDVGTKVIPVKDLEPGTNRQFKLTFKPIAGDNVKNHEVTVGDLVE
ncbi:MAG: hypothetical protein PHF74_05005 [Dehalococcoidales bacterium]|nr:hypothetical protein [Dehalococcoidales bacterium]